MMMQCGAASTALVVGVMHAYIILPSPKIAATDSGVELSSAQNIPWDDSVARTHLGFVAPVIDGWVSVDAATREENSSLRSSKTEKATETYRALKGLHEWLRDPGETAPDDAALRRAMHVVDDLRSLADSERLFWVEPSVTASPQGEVVFEWWMEEKRLTLYIASGEVVYVASWGVSIENEMTDGVLAVHDDFRRIWRWLMAGAV